MELRDHLNAKMAIEVVGWLAPVSVMVVGFLVGFTPVIQLGGLLLVARALYFYIGMEE